jgi:large subunit ribosomal protein L9
LQHIRRQTDQKAKKELEALGDAGKNLAKISLTFEVQTGKDNKLFGSVTSKDVAEKLAAQGVEVDRKKIHLPQPLKELGTFSVAVKLHRDVVPKISVTLVKKGEEEAVPEEAASNKSTDGTATE